MPDKIWSGHLSGNHLIYVINHMICELKFYVKYLISLKT
jgi:hypothetical protein